MTQWVDSLPDHRTKVPSVTFLPPLQSHLTLKPVIRPFASPLVAGYGQPSICHPIRDAISGVLPQSDPDISAVHTLREI